LLSKKSGASPMTLPDAYLATHTLAALPDVYMGVAPAGKDDNELHRIALSPESVAAASAKPNSFDTLDVPLQPADPKDHPNRPLSRLRSEELPQDATTSLPPAPAMYCWMAAS
jgi:hypothetical protein